MSADNRQELSCPASPKNLWWNRFGKWRRPWLPLFQRWKGLLQRCRSSPQNNPKPLSLGSELAIFFLLYCLFWFRQFRLNSGFDRLFYCLWGLCTKSSCFSRRLQAFLGRGWRRTKLFVLRRRFLQMCKTRHFWTKTISSSVQVVEKKLGALPKVTAVSRPGVLPKCLPQGCYPNLYLPKRAKLSRSAIIFWNLQMFNWAHYY